MSLHLFRETEKAHQETSSAAASDETTSFASELPPDEPTGLLTNPRRTTDSIDRDNKDDNNDKNITAPFGAEELPIEEYPAIRTKDYYDRGLQQSPSNPPEKEGDDETFAEEFPVDGLPVANKSQGARVSDDETFAEEFPVEDAPAGADVVVERGNRHSEKPFRSKHQNHDDDDGTFAEEFPTGGLSSVSVILNHGDNNETFAEEVPAEEASIPLVENKHDTNTKGKILYNDVSKRTLDGNMRSASLASEQLRVDGGAGEAPEASSTLVSSAMQDLGPATNQSQSGAAPFQNDLENGEEQLPIAQAVASIAEPDARSATIFHEAKPFRSRLRLWIGLGCLIVLVIPVVITTVVLTSRSGGVSEAATLEPTASPAPTTSSPSIEPTLSSVPSSTPTAFWNFLGSDIDGDVNTLFGFVVDVAEIDGQGDGPNLKLVAGAPGDTAAEDPVTSGTVRTFSFENGQWIASAQELSGEALGDGFGIALSLSGDGSVLAVGAPLHQNTGLVRIYQASSSRSNQWVQLGQDLLGESTESRFGEHVDLSRDGSTVVATAPLEGLVGRVYVFVYADSSWTQRGPFLPGFAQSLTTSSDGSILAIGFRIVFAFSNVMQDRVQVFTFDGEEWQQLGETLMDPEENGQFGNSISLSSDGRLLAIGEPFNSEKAFQGGKATMFAYVDGEWTPYGQFLQGDQPNEYFAYSVSFSSDGGVLAVGARGNSQNGFGAGAVTVYEYVGGFWQQVGPRIYGEAVDAAFSGHSVAVTRLGNVVAIGAPFNPENGVNAGHVRVYRSLE